MTFELPAPLRKALPPPLAARLSSYRWQRVTLGRSAADVFRLAADGQPDLFLKSESIGPFATLPGEAAKATWLARQGVPCPDVLALESHAGRHWLLSRAVRGRDLASSTDIAAEDRVASLATGLRRLHDIDPTTCPFDRNLAHCLAEAQARVIANLVDEADFDEVRKGETAVGLLERLQRQQPTDFDPVVTHGDASLPNVMAQDGTFSGFVDLGRLGVADRYQDLALAVWSVRYNLGARWVQTFVDGYGLSTADCDKLAFYKALDEFF